jgi:hypothetical protein
MTYFVVFAVPDQLSSVLAGRLIGTRRASIAQEIGCQ